MARGNAAHPGLTRPTQKPQADARAATPDAEADEEGKETPRWQDLDEKALQLAPRLKFYPALNGAEPVPAWFAVPFTFPSGR